MYDQVCGVTAYLRPQTAVMPACRPWRDPVAVPSGGIFVVIVSRDRPLELTQTLEAVRRQAVTKPLHILVVDSSVQTQPVARLCAALDRVFVIRSERNIGGAGGFALGMLRAMAAGAEWIWLMDDDGRPRNRHVLARLLRTAGAHDLDAVAPAVIDAADPARFAFPYPQHHRYVFRRDALAPGALLPSFAHLFNGLLIRAAAIFETGLPDVRMFIRGDEVDFMHRMRRAGLRFATDTAAEFSHPSANDEIFPIWGGRLHVTLPAAGWKRRCQFRNRAYNFLRHGMWLLMAVDLLRYPYFFLVCRRGDFAGLREWLACSWQGARGRLRPEPGTGFDGPPPGAALDEAGRG